jgi:hypothetical protein
VSSGAAKLRCSPLMFSVGMVSSRSREARRSAVLPFRSFGLAEQARIDLAVQALFQFLAQDTPKMGQPFALTNKALRGGSADQPT